MPAAGERVGEYIIDQKVGAGTFGEVWRAHHHVWADRVVAIKVPTDAEFVKVLQREGTAIHGLSHPNIVSALNFDPYATPPYLAMEFIPGTSLRGLLQAREGGRLTFNETGQILTGVLAALAYAHGQGVIHRDIKPENVLIHERALTEGFATPGVVKLTDFGLGQKAAQYAANSIAYTASIERGSDLAGTLAYMSPEQRSGQPLDARSDLYSCGVMLFEMLVGERPAGTELPSELNTAVPKAFDDVFRRAYARLAIRYPSAAEFSKGIEVALKTGGIRVPPPVPVGPPPIPPAMQSPNQQGPFFPPPSSDQPAPARRASVPAQGCPKCGTRVSPMDQFCMGCGHQLVDRVRRCTSCGAYPHADDLFCLVCGRDLPVTGYTSGRSR